MSKIIKVENIGYNNVPGEELELYTIFTIEEAQQLEDFYITILVDQSKETTEQNGGPAFRIRVRYNKNINGKAWEVIKRYTDPRKVEQLIELMDRAIFKMQNEEEIKELAKEVRKLAQDK